MLDFFFFFFFRDTGLMNLVSLCGKAGMFEEVGY